MTLKNNVHNFLKNPISNIVVIGWIPITLFCLVIYSFLLTSLSNQRSEEIINNLAKFKLGISTLFVFSCINLLHLLLYHFQKVKNDRSLAICVASEIAIVSTMFYRIQTLSFDMDNSHIEESAKINVYLILAFITIKLFGLSLMKKLGTISFLQSTTTSITNK